MDKMFIENESNYSFDETIEILDETITNSGWKVMITHDLQATLLNKGIHVLPVSVIELCNPKYSAQLLKEDDLRLYSTMMPCRISVYEKTDGKTYISILNSALLSVQLGGLVEKVMTEAYKDVHSFVSIVI